MKRLVSFVIFLFCIPLLGLAQEVKVPAWEKFVSVTSDRVNLRKAPNAQSSRLMIKEYEVELTFQTEYSWTTGAGKKPFCLSKGQVVPVIDESGMWYHVFLENGYDAYIRKDFCEQIEPIVFTQDEKLRHLGMGIGTAYKVLGNNDLYIAYEENEEDGSSALIGRPFGAGIVWRSCDGLLEYLLSVCGGYADAINLDIKKVKYDSLKTFLSTHKLHEPYAISYVFYSDDLYLSEAPSFTYVFDSEKNPLRKVNTPETYAIKKFVVSANGQELRMYQKPSLTAPKLVFLPEESIFRVGRLDWESNKQSRMKKEHAASKVFAVIGEEGDWYQVYDSYNYSEIYSSIGYIPKNAVRDAEIMPITEAVLTDESFNIRNGYGKTRLLQLPDNRTCVVTWGCPRVGICVTEFVNVGYIHNNIAIMSRNFSYGYDDRHYKVSIAMSTFNGRRLVVKSSDDFWNVDFTKLKVEEAQVLLNDLPENAYCFAYVNIDNEEMHIFDIGGFFNGKQIVINDN